MKKFDEMNEAEQKAWWLEQAKEVLPFMMLRDAKIEWLAYTHNAVFSVIKGDDAYVLRMSPRKSSLSLIGGEVDVLRVLAQKGISAPIVASYGSRKESLHVLFKRLDGIEKTSDTLLMIDIKAIGVYLAKFHLCDFPKIPLSSGIRSSLDYDGLFSDAGLYPLTDSAKALFSPQQLNLMDTVAQVVKSAMDELGQGEDEFGLIHGDLLLKNILFHEGEVRALDFEYCGWGYYLYDLCPLLWQLKPLSNYKELEEALWNGYCSIRSLTERHHKLLETFIVARQVASMRWVAANQHNPAYQGKVESILQQRTAELQGFLETGILTRS